VDTIDDTEAIQPQQLSSIAVTAIVLGCLLALSVILNLFLLLR
jgi:hypothetical protein